MSRRMLRNAKVEATIRKRLISQIGSVKVSPRVPVGLRNLVGRHQQGTGNAFVLAAARICGGCRQALADHPGRGIDKILNDGR